METALISERDSYNKLRENLNTFSLAIKQNFSDIDQITEKNLALLKEKTQDVDNFYEKIRERVAEDQQRWINTYNEMASDNMKFFENLQASFREAEELIRELENEDKLYLNGEFNEFDFLERKIARDEVYNKIIDILNIKDVEENQLFDRARGYSQDQFNDLFYHKKKIEENMPNEYCDFDEAKALRNLQGYIFMSYKQIFPGINDKD